MTLGPQQNAEETAEATGTEQDLAIDQLGIDEGSSPEKDAKRAAKKEVAAGRSPMQIAWARLKRDKVAWICAIITLLFILMAIFAPLLADLEGQSPNQPNQNLLDLNGMPLFQTNSEHWLGVEPNQGRDLWARFVYGSRPSIAIALIASLVSTVIGVVMGLVAGYFGGWVDRAISWLIDFILSLPFLLFALALVPIAQSWFGNIYTITDAQITRIRFFALCFVLVFFYWAGLARLVRGEVMSMREKEFIQAARALGVPTRQILFKEMIPNLIGIIIVSLTMAIPGFIASEAGLAYLGVGLITVPDWGVTIASAQNYFQVQPLYLWVPAAAVALLVLSMSLLGDAVADAFNPNTRR